VVVENQHITMN